MKSAAVSGGKYESIRTRKGPRHLCLVVICKSFVVFIVQEVPPEVLVTAAQYRGDHEGAGGDTAQDHHQHHMLHAAPDHLWSPVSLSALT